MKVKAIEAQRELRAGDRQRRAQPERRFPDEHVVLPGSPRDPPRREIAAAPRRRLDVVSRHRPADEIARVVNRRRRADRRAIGEIQPDAEVIFARDGRQRRFRLRGAFLLVGLDGARAEVQHRGHPDDAPRADDLRPHDQQARREHEQQARRADPEPEEDAEKQPSHRRRLRGRRTGRAGRAGPERRCPVRCQASRQAPCARRRSRRCGSIGCARRRRHADRASCGGC